jgi:hypothetical protein
VGSQVADCQWECMSTHVKNLAYLFINKSRSSSSYMMMSEELRGMIELHSCSPLAHCCAVLQMIKFATYPRKSTEECSLIRESQLPISNDSNASLSQVVLRNCGMHYRRCEVVVRTPERGSKITSVTSRNHNTSSCQD